MCINSWSAFFQDIQSSRRNIFERNNNQKQDNIAKIIQRDNIWYFSIPTSIFHPFPRKMFQLCKYEDLICFTKALLNKKKKCNLTTLKYNPNKTLRMKLVSHNTLLKSDNRETTVQFQKHIKPITKIKRMNQSMNKFVLNWNIKKKKQPFNKCNYL